MFAFEVQCDGEEPRSERLASIEIEARAVKLEKRLLQQVASGFGFAQVPPENTQQDWRIASE